jgi:hypothetical protein
MRGCFWKKRRRFGRWIADTQFSLQVYLSDLKLHLSALTKSDPARLSRTTQDRVEALQTEIANLLQACPDVGNPTMAFAPDTRVDGPYFTPTPDKAAVYDRLVERVYLLLGAESPPVTGERGEAELMNVCAGIWGIECKRIRELAVTFSFWKSAVRANGAANGDVKSTVRTRMMGEYASESVTESDRDALSWTERVREILEDLAADAETGLTEEEVRPCPIAVRQRNSNLIAPYRLAGIGPPARPC